MFVRNATEGVNAVLRSVSLDAGDEILVTNHGYAACNNVVRHVTQKAGAQVRCEFGFENLTQDEVVEKIHGVNSKTRVALLTMSRVLRGSSFRLNA